MNIFKKIFMKKYIKFLLKIELIYIDKIQPYAPLFYSYYCNNICLSNKKRKFNFNHNIFFCIFIIMQVLFNKIKSIMIRLFIKIFILIFIFANKN